MGGGGFARVLLYNGLEHDKLGLPDLVLGVATPCPEPVLNNPEANRLVPDTQTRKQQADKLFAELGLNVNPKLQNNKDLA